MLALLLASTLAAAAHELVPRRAEWSEVDAAIFPSAWILPEELWRPADDEQALPLALKRVLALRFEAPSAWMASVGDLALEHRRRGGTAAALDALLAELAAALPAVHAEVEELLRGVLVADALRAPDWDPEQDSADDGVWFGPALARNALASEPWRSLSGSRAVHQAATLIHADLDALLVALHDYSATRGDPGTSYEELAPLAPTFVTGESERGPFAALRLAIRSDLPFPFGHYDCDLGVLHLLDAEQELVTYVFSASEDFHWLAGQDFHFPVRTAEGEWVGTLLVRVTGFDLRGVPDREAHRREGTRAALGNLRRRAEAEFTRYGGPPRTVAGALPPLRASTR